MVSKQTRDMIEALLVSLEGMEREQASSMVAHMKAKAQRWLTRKQAASMLGVTPRTLTRWQEQGRIEPTRLSCRKHRFAEADILALMA